jgi:hypothetical protein
VKSPTPQGPRRPSKSVQAEPALGTLLQALEGHSPPCPFCGDPYELTLCEIYPEDRSFQLDACCERARSCAIELLADPAREPEICRDLLDALGWSVCTGRRARSIYTTDWGHLEVDQGLHLTEIDWQQACTFIASYHAHNEPPAGWKFGFGVRNWQELVAVATVGRPTARLLDRPGNIEITRVCVNRERPRSLTKDACSMLYGAAARRARHLGFERILTYTRLDEPGTSLRAAGFRPIVISRGGSWHRARRPRARRPSNETPKVRWEKHFPENAGVNQSKDHPHCRQIALFPPLGKPARSRRALPDVAHIALAARRRP